MKRFLCFAGISYYAEGGWGDFKGDYETVEAAQAANPIDGPHRDDPEWRQVVDTETMTVVEDTAADRAAEFNARLKAGVYAQR